jgi:hypothetical protein
MKARLIEILAVVSILAAIVWLVVIAAFSPLRSIPLRWGTKSRPGGKWQANIRVKNDRRPFCSRLSHPIRAL